MQSVSAAYRRLNKKTLEKLQTRPRNILLKDIAAVTGINEAWLKNYSSNRIKSPNIEKLETLQRYFQTLV